MKFLQENHRILWNFFILVLISVFSPDLHLSIIKFIHKIIIQTGMDYTIMRYRLRNEHVEMRAWRNSMSNWKSNSTQITQKITKALGKRRDRYSYIGYWSTTLLQVRPKNIWIWNNRESRLCLKITSFYMLFYYFKLEIFFLLAL